MTETEVGFLGIMTGRRNGIHRSPSQSFAVIYAGQLLYTA